MLSVRESEVTNYIINHLTDSQLILLTAVVDDCFQKNVIS